jgi:3-hydroxyisobutyrate dehydrogenase-like beta-hydroxyacid dehydrogenase
MPTVAIVGCGRMGSAMARALTRNGLELVLYNRTMARAEALAMEVGGRVVGSPAEAAAAAEVVITMLSDDAAVRATFLDPAGLAAGAHAGAVLVDMSTVEPATILAVSAAVRARGAGLLDAPVSGSVHLAEAGTLTVMVGGDAADLDRARPILERLARTIVHLGPLGSGAAMKLAVNTLIYAVNGGLSEALILAEAAGIDRTLAYDVIAASAVGSPFIGYKRAAFLDPDGTPVAFGLDLAAKDLRLIAALAERLGLEMPQADANRALVEAAATDGRGGNDFSMVAAELRARRRTPAGVGPEGEGRPD